MIKRICDRCRVDVSTYYTMKVVRGTPYMTTEICSYDLCDDCWNDFMRFLEQKPLLKQEESK